jgi:mannose-1-phosphate guanylyltransferase
MKCLVLAAGMSTRLAALTGGAPKPLTPIAGVPVLHRNLRWLASAGIKEIYINLHHRAEEVKASVGDGSQFGLRVEWSHENPILGTAGAAKKLERELGANRSFLMVYGDNVLNFDLKKFTAAAEKNPALVTIAVFDPAKNANTGIAGGRVQCDPNGRATAFVEGQPSATGLVNAGVYVCDARVLKKLSPPPKASDWARDVFPALLAAGETLRAEVIDGYCLGIDTPEAYERAQELFRTGAVN